MISLAGMRTSVAVVIPTYNRAATLGRAVTSCQRQTRRVDEIVIVDDGSSDETPSLVEAWKKSDARIRYLRLPENRGAQAARIEGIVATSCEWVTLLDSDDELLSDSVQSRLETAERCGLEPGLVYGDIVVPVNGERTIQSFERLNGYAYPRLCRTLRTPWTITQMIRRRCFDVTGYPDPAFPALQGADMALTIGRIFPIAHCGKPVAVRHDSTGQISKDKVRHARAYTLLIDKYAKDILRYHGPMRLLFWRLVAFQKKINYEMNRSDVMRARWKHAFLRIANGGLAQFLRLVAT